MNKKNMRQGFIIIFCSIISLFIGSYFNCDALYYKRIVRFNEIETPNDAFEFFKKATINAYQDPLKPQVISGLPTRDLIETHRGFWCDEGAIGMGKLLEYTKIKYNYRLVDIYGPDNISHHTVLQVYENNNWRTYDVFFKTNDVRPENTPGFGPVLKLGYRQWNSKQKFYHFCIENSSIIKYIVLKIRGVY